MTFLFSQYVLVANCSHCYWSRIRFSQKLKSSKPHFSCFFPCQSIFSRSFQYCLYTLKTHVWPYPQYFFFEWNYWLALELFCWIPYFLKVSHHFSEESHAPWHSCGSLWLGHYFQNWCWSLIDLFVGWRTWSPPMMVDRQSFQNYLNSYFKI